jgi:hypothetical protein
MRPTFGYVGRAIDPPVGGGCVSRDASGSSAFRKTSRAARRRVFGADSLREALTSRGPPGMR